MIDIYMAGNCENGLFERLLDHNVDKLFNYVTEMHGIKKFIEYVSGHPQITSKLFVDSGAFTAWTLGHDIDVDAYIKFLNENNKYLTLAGQVDSIPGTKGKIGTPEDTRIAAEKTWDNYLYMRERLNNPDLILYTFHIGEPLEFLKQALEWRDENGNPIKYMAFGGMVGKPRSVRDGFLNAAFHIIKNSSNPDIKVHAFGMTDRMLLKKYPITSADSTTWIKQAVLGRLYTPVGLITVSDVQKHSLDHLDNFPEDIKMNLEEFFNKYELTTKELKESYKDRKFLNAMYIRDQIHAIEQLGHSKKRKLFSI